MANQAHPGAMFHDMATLQSDSAENPAVMSGNALFFVFELVVIMPMCTSDCICITLH